MRTRNQGMRSVTLDGMISTKEAAASTRQFLVEHGCSICGPKPARNQSAYPFAVWVYVTAEPNLDCPGKSWRVTPESLTHARSLLGLDPALAPPRSVVCEHMGHFIE